MSSVSGVTSNTSQQTASTSLSGYGQEMGKTQFLELLVAQLKNQDPMNPTDSQEFITQLTSFSSLEQLMSINENVTQLVDASEGTASTEGSGE